MSFLASNKLDRDVSFCRADFTADCFRDAGGLGPAVLCRMTSNPIILIAGANLTRHDK